MFFSKISFLAAAFVAGVSMSGAFAELQVGDLCALLWSSFTAEVPTDYSFILGVGFTGPVNDTCEIALTTFSPHKNVADDILAMV